MTPLVSRSRRWTTKMLRIFFEDGLDGLLLAFAVRDAEEAGGLLIAMTRRFRRGYRVSSLVFFGTGRFVVIGLAALRGFAAFAPLGGMDLAGLALPFRGVDAAVAGQRTGRSGGRL